MYSFVFYFIYRTQLNQKNGGPIVGRIVGSIFVFIFSWVHLLFVFGIFKYIRFNFYGLETSSPLGEITVEKLLFIVPILIITSTFLYKYFNLKKIEELENRYHSGKKFYSFWSILMFLSLFFIPVFGFAYLINHSRY